MVPESSTVYDEVWEAVSMRSGPLSPASTSLVQAPLDHLVDQEGVVPTLLKLQVDLAQIRARLDARQACPVTWKTRADAVRSCCRRSRGR